MAASSVHVGVVIHPEDKQLKTVAHSLLESKLEKMLSSAGSASDPNHTKRQAIDWIKQWDLDGDGIISELELKVAAMQHAKLQIGHSRRGAWLAALVVLALCCFCVILGLSVWANDVSQESKGEWGRSDLGGFTLRAKDSAAVVKTGTALYEFGLDWVGSLPFDELSQVTGVGFAWNQAIHFMDVEGFQWFGTNNVSLFSPRGAILSVSRPAPKFKRITFQEPGDPAPAVVYDGPAFYADFNMYLDAGILLVKQMGFPLTIDNVFKYYWIPAALGNVQGDLPVDCVAPGIAYFSGDSSARLDETCAVAVLMALQGHGVVEAGVGPQDYYGTKMTQEEAAGLTPSTWQFSAGNIFDPDKATFREKLRKTVQERINVLSKAPT